MTWTWTTEKKLSKGCIKWRIDIITFCTMRLSGISIIVSIIIVWFLAYCDLLSSSSYDIVHTVKFNISYMTNTLLSIESTIKKSDNWR